MSTEAKPKLRLTQKEAAAYCQMDPDVFRDWCKVREIKTIPNRPGKNSRRYLPKVLDEFLAWMETEEANQAAANYTPSQMTEVLIVRRVTSEKRPRNGAWPVYVSHEHITDKSFGVMLNQIEPA